MKKSLIFLPLAVLALVGCGEKEGTSGAAPTAPSAGPVIVTTGGSGGGGGGDTSGKPTPRTVEGYTEVVDAPTPGTGYKMGYYDTTKGKYFFLNGAMKATYYLDAAESMSTAIDITVASSGNGFTLQVASGSNSGKYLNIYVSGTHVNAAYQASAGTAWDYVATEEKSGHVNEAYSVGVKCASGDYDPQYYVLCKQDDDSKSISPSYGKWWGSNFIVRLYKPAA